MHYNGEECYCDSYAYCDDHSYGEFVKYDDHVKVVDQLQQRIAQLESEKYINEIKAQGIEEAVKKADGETYIGLPNQCFPPQKQYRVELLCYAEQLRAKHE